MKDNWTDLRRAHSYTLALRFIDAAIRWHNYESAVDPASPGTTRFIRNCFCLARQLAERRRRQALRKHQQEGQPAAAGAGANPGGAATAAMGPDPGRPGADRRPDLVSGLAQGHEGRG